MNKIELAKWLHNNYEEVAKDENWNTQEKCKVEFDTLPDANKRTMIEIADRLLNFNLLRLHFVSNNEANWKDLPIEDRDALNANWRTDNLGKNSEVAVCLCPKQHRYTDTDNIERCDLCKKITN